MNTVSKTFTYSRYAAYKDSGVEWIGEIPEHWQVRRSKFLFTQRKEQAWKDDVQLSATQAYGVILQDEYEKKVGRKVVKIQFHLEKRKHVEKDDFVISMRSFQGGLERAHARGCIRSSYVILKPLEKINSSFYSYLLKLPRYIEALQRTGNFIRDGQDLNFENFSQVDLYIPPISEQKSIAGFLDQKTAAIDAAIAKKQRLIELLKEQKAILINRAVTRGLNTDVPMKDSGVEWLGEIPAHWELKKVKHLSSFITSGPRGWSDFFSDEGAYFLQSGNLNNSMGIELRHAVHVAPPFGAEGVRTRLKNQDVLVCITGANTGRIALAKFKDEEIYINQHLSLIRPTSKLVLPEYLALSLYSTLGRTYFFLQQYGLKEGLSLSDVKNALCLSPPLSEQKLICEFASKVTLLFDNVIRKTIIEIEKIKEYKQTLIAHAVTGKIKVS